MQRGTAPKGIAMINDKVRQLLAEMKVLEDDLATALHEQQSKMFFEIKGKRIEFTSEVRAAHHKLKRGLLRWIGTRPRNLVTFPIIYAMIVPLLLVDACLSFYQATCFPVYGIRKVRRRDYIVIDRQQLGYLNIIEKFHCSYCAYGTGVIAYSAEIVARTEQYFCPIKHARKMLGTHARYASFIEYGDAEDYHARLEEYRDALGKEP